MTRVAVVMPAWNEEEGIADFIGELDSALSRYEAVFIVVDDASTDATALKLEELMVSGIGIEYQTNPENSGHGASTVKALELGMRRQPDLVVSLDGDGQFLGSDVVRTLEASLAEDADVVEGVRTNRGEPFYRSVTSLATRCLVWMRSGKWPADANTPLRVYKPDVLRALLEIVPEGNLTPNLIISVVTRRRNLHLVEVPVRSLPRRGSSRIGSTWGSAPLQLPDRRFLVFCWRAFMDWVSLPR